MLRIVSLPLRKVFELLLIVGLLIILLRVRRIEYFMLLLFTKYRALFPYIYAHAQLESANFTSRVYQIDRNAFGIKFINSARQVNAVRGLMSPEGDNYARFNSELDSLRDLMRIFEVKKMPISVSSADEYGKALKDRGYFTSGLDSYVKNLKFWLDKKIV